MLSPNQMAVLLQNLPRSSRKVKNGVATITPGGEEDDILPEYSWLHFTMHAALRHFVLLFYYRKNRPGKSKPAAGLRGVAHDLFSPLASSSLFVSVIYVRTCSVCLYLYNGFTRFSYFYMSGRAQ
jgi:hypothetical protein